MSTTTHTPPSARPTSQRRVRRRVGWGVLGLLGLGFVVFESVTHGGWVTAATVLGIVGPDLAFLAAIGAEPTPQGVLPRRVVPVYNALHRVVGPLLLLAVSLLPAVPLPVFVLAIAWLTHIAVDRAAGYGLRAPDGTIAGGVAGIRE